MFSDLEKLDWLKKLQLALPKANLFLVGGMVRDVSNVTTGLKPVSTKDYDFVCQGVEIDVLEKNLAKLGKVILVGKNFGVLKFIPKNSKLEIDIALPRQDFAQGTGGYRDMQAQADPNLAIEDDLARRDFTINAMAWDIKNKKLIDPFAGQKDLKNKIIRAVAEPEKRFQEDYTRMLRAIRFACQFSARGGPAPGWEIEEKTWVALKKLMPKMTSDITPWETIGKEFLKSLTNPVKAIKLLDESGALKQIMPEILEMKGCEQPPKYHSEGDVWTHTMMMLSKILHYVQDDSFNFQPDGAFVLAVILHDVGKPYTKKIANDRVRFHGHDLEGVKIATKICQRLRFTNKQTKKIKFLVKNHMLSIKGDVKQMRDTTIEKYYLSEFGYELLILLWLDAGCSITADNSDTLQNFRTLKKRMEKLSAKKDASGKMPADILDGDEIMAELNIKPGKKVQKIKDELRELQLRGKIKTKDDAIIYLSSRPEGERSLKCKVRKK